MKKMIVVGKDIFDVACYLSEVIDDPEAEPQNYWVDTSSNAILNDFLYHKDIDAAEKFESF